MINYKEFSTYNKIIQLFEEIPTSKERVLEIKSTRAFHEVIESEIQKLKLKYRIVTLDHLVNDIDNRTIKKRGVLFSIVKKTIIFIIGFFLNAISNIFSVLNFLVDLAHEVSNYNLKESDLLQLKRTLKVSKKKRKYKKINTIILVSDVGMITSEEKQYLEFLAHLIEQRHITSCLLLIHNKSDNVRESIIASTTHDFSLSGDELKHLFYESSDVAAAILNDIGIEYFSLLEKLYPSSNTRNDLTEQLVHLIVKDSNYTDYSQEISHFLTVCSFLFDGFKRLDLENLSKQIEVYYRIALRPSLSMNILKEPRNNMYSFSEIFFKEYFRSISIEYLSYDDCKKIIQYLEKEYPTEYANLALVAKTMPLKEEDILSYHIIAYYHHKDQSISFVNLITEYLSNNELGSKLLELEYYRLEIHKYSKAKLMDVCDKTLELIKISKELSIEARLCALNYVADVFYEIETISKNFSDIFNYYIELFTEANLFSNKNEKYADYVLDAIIYASVAEEYSIRKITDRLIHWLESCEINNKEKKIKFYKLGNLLHALDPNQAVSYTKKAYNLSEGNVILHEESKLNYGVSLLGLARYQEAYDLYHSFKFKTQNCKIAIENNTIIAAYYSNKYSSKKVRNEFKKICNTLDSEIKSDSCIVRNNYVSSLLLDYHDENIEEIEKISYSIIASNDVYSEFYARHNLMILYYLNNDRANFEQVVNKLKVPYLMRNHVNLIERKVDFLKSNFYKYNSIHQLDEVLREKFGEDNYGNDLTLRPLLFGLMERWFK